MIRIDRFNKLDGPMQNLIRILFLNIFLIFFSVGCLKTFPVLEDPPPGEEGMVAFGLIVSKGGLSDGIFSGLENPVSNYTKISTVGDSSRYVSLKDSGKQMEGDGNYRFLWVQKLRLGEDDPELPAFFAVSRLPPNKPLLISHSSYTYTTTTTYTTVDKYGNVRTHTSTTVHTLGIPIDYSSSDLSKFSFSNPGGTNIKFLGNFVAHPSVPNLETNRPYRGTYMLTNLNEYLQRFPAEGAILKRKFYGVEDITETGAEIYFLKRFIVENRSRYWEGIAIRRLLQLDPDIRMEALNSKIAIPKEDLPIGGMEK
ncbi:hypothetical protein [Leptospira wolffii]|uniref:hypothetical protein n=1 Tax=Leptospira wolffii TaxID=409998 RepID=UPI001FEF332C|nr:hypothetical protein [Leptospira wolffii]